MNKRIVTIQDISCFGQCSITVALPILSAYGIETAILPSAVMSTHTGGFTDFTVHDLTDEMPKILAHWEKEGIDFDAIYTGYIGDARQFEIIKEARSLLRGEKSLIVDPAMADHGVLYSALNDDIVDGMKTIVKEADLILPNLTEAAFLLDREYKESYTREEIDVLLHDLCEMGAKCVVITGVSYQEDKLGAASFNRVTGEKCEYFTQRINESFHGTGDVFASVVIANILGGRSVQSALGDACEFVVSCIKNTMKDTGHTYGVKFEEMLAINGRRL